MMRINKNLFYILKAPGVALPLPHNEIGSFEGKLNKTSHERKLSKKDLTDIVDKIGVDL